MGIDHEGSIYVADSGRGRIFKFNKYEEYLFAIGKDAYYDDKYNHVVPDELISPKHIAFDSQNNIYIVSESVVKKFDKSGKFVTRLKVISDGKEMVYSAYDIAVGPDDNIFVTVNRGDVWPSERTVVYKFDKEGNFLKWWKSGVYNDGWCYEF
ncbi:MAG: hypothetical protein PHU71_06445, partial [Candidatus Gracilibacteria bacterium]|nr:hypothetical protein [Candidatus Gracilibacteria bacterium]